MTSKRTHGYLETTDLVSGEEIRICTRGAKRVSHIHKNGLAEVWWETTESLWHSDRNRVAAHIDGGTPPASLSIGGSPSLSRKSSAASQRTSATRKPSLANPSPKVRTPPAQGGQSNYLDLQTLPLVPNSVSHDARTPRTPSRPLNAQQTDLRSSQSRGVSRGSSIASQRAGGQQAPASQSTKVQRTPSQVSHSSIARRSAGVQAPQSFDNPVENASRDDPGQQHASASTRSRTQDPDTNATRDNSNVRQRKAAGRWKGWMKSSCCM